MRLNQQATLYLQEEPVGRCVIGSRHEPRIAIRASVTLSGTAQERAHHLSPSEPAHPRRLHLRASLPAIQIHVDGQGLQAARLRPALSAPIGRPRDKFSIQSSNEESLVNESLKNDTAHRHVYVPKKSCLL
jgi:hypothetical protein